MENSIFIANFLGWCTVINLAFYAVSAIALTFGKSAISSLHAKLSGVSQEKLNALYFNYLSRFKLIILIFNLTPYLALRIMLS